MRKTVIVVTVLIAGVFGVGYVFGQIGGVSPSAAAGVAPTAGQTRSAIGTFPFRGHDQGPGQADTPHADGQITAVNGNTVTVKADADRAGSNEQTAVTTIVLTATTQYGPAGKSAIAVGSYIRAEGSLSSDGKTLTATTVEAGAGGGPGFGHGGPVFGRGPHADGIVTAVAGNTISVKADADRAGSNEDTSVTTILLTATTTYDAGHDAAVTTGKPAIAVGSYIIAEGTLSADGKTLTATQVAVRTGGAPIGGPQPGPAFNGPGA